MISRKLHQCTYLPQMFFEGVFGKIKFNVCYSGLRKYFNLPEQFPTYLWLAVYSKPTENCIKVKTRTKFFYTLVDGKREYLDYHACRVLQSFDTDYVYIGVWYES